MIHVFVGPTIATEAAASILDATYHPPVEQGDVLAVCEQGASLIAIIDGYFDLVPSVWHKEILVALESGVVVCGAASMGALRAAELAPMGMIGVGQVFRWYHQGVLVDDDEVALIHAPAEHGYRAHSEAMVDIRSRVGAATEAGVLDDLLAEEVITTAKALNYRDRSLRRAATIVRQRAPAAATPLDRLEAWLAAERPLGVKHADAVELLTRIAEGTLPPPSGTPPPVSATVFLSQLRAEVRRRRAVEELGGASPELDDDAVLPHGETLAVTRKKVMLRLLVRREAARLGLDATADELQAEADRFRLESGLHQLDATLRWFADRGITEETWTRFLTDRVLATKVERTLAHEIDAEVADHVRIAVD